MQNTDDQDRDVVLYLTEAPAVDRWRQGLANLPIAEHEGSALLLVGDLELAPTDTIAELAN
jgi:hypothetical protein